MTSHRPNYPVRKAGYPTTRKCGSPICTQNDIPTKSLVYNVISVCLGDRKGNHRYLYQSHTPKNTLGRHLAGTTKNLPKALFLIRVILTTRIETIDKAFGDNWRLLTSVKIPTESQLEIWQICRFKPTCLGLSTTGNKMIEFMKRLVSRIKTSSSVSS